MVKTFWEVLEDATKEVEAWPQWKKDAADAYLEAFEQSMENYRSSNPYGDAQ